MANIYELESAKILKVCVIGNGNNDLFYDFLNEYVFDRVKICPNFILKTLIIKDKEFNNLNEYNFIFYVTTIEKIKDNNTFSEIKKVSDQLEDPMNHLFVIIDGCDNLEIDDDGDLVFSDDNDEVLYQNFDGSLSKIINDKLFHCCRISLDMAKIWKTIDDDSSIVNLTEEQINLLAPRLVKKSSKMPISDKKREIKLELKKISIDDKIAQVGYKEFYDSVTQYFKLLYQKRVICRNYLFYFNKINVSLLETDMININNLLREIYGITYLKTDMHDDLIDKVDAILLAKFKHFCIKCKNYVVIDPKAQQYVDAYAYHKFLLQFVDISEGYNLSNVMEITKQEINTVNILITEYHKKEMERVTDLDKISSYLEIFAVKDKNNLNSLFDKIRNYPKIIQENIENMEKWITFIDRCLKIGIPKDSIIKLVEEIIILKISHYNELSLRTNNKELSAVYPLCLQIFLLSNINRDFIFKKLYMYVSYSARYSGRNISELIISIKEEQYQSMLILENKLLDICSTHIEEQSQRMNLSEVDIVETFNENVTNTKEKNIKSKNIRKKNISDDNNSDTDSSSEKSNKKSTSKFTSKKKHE
jgi:hypothetical protein